MTRPGRRRWDWNRNEWLGILNGWAVFIGDGFMSSTVVIAGFATRLGAPNWMIGLLPGIAFGGWLLPQLFIASRVRGRPYKLPVYRSAALVRTATYIAMILITAFLADQPALCLTLFLTAMLVNALASGVSGLPFLEVVSKTVPSERRPRYFATRNLYGGLLAFGAGILVRQILAGDLAFPLDYTLIFSLGSAAYVLGYWIFGLVQEPPDAPQAAQGFRAELRSIPVTLQDRPFRAFLHLRLLLAAASMSESFYAANALRTLNFPAASLGVFVMAVMGAAPLANPIWQRVAERRGSRRILRYATAVSVLAAFWALTVTVLRPPQPLALPAYLPVFMLSSIAAQGFNLGHTNYLLNLAPDHARSRYIGTLNTLIAPALLFPALGGLLADWLGYAAVFTASIMLGLAAWIVGGQLKRDA